MKLHYKIYGTGQPLIILHGLFGMGDNWRTISKKLESGYRCILVDLRNHGRSPHQPLMTIQVMVEDLMELMTDLHLEKAILMGHSLGGKVAMQFALDYPEKVEKLIVVDIAPKIYLSQHDHVLKAIKAIDPGTLKDRSQAEEILKTHLGKDQATVQFILKNLTRRSEGGFKWKANMPVLLDTYDQLMENVLASSDYKGPVLFIRGQNSNYVKDEDLLRIRELFPQATLLTIPGAGHWVHADAPGPFSQEVLAFL